MKKFEAWEKVNDSEWEQDGYSEPIEAESETEALELYIDSIEENLRTFDAVRVDDGYPYSATFTYQTDVCAPMTVLEIKMKEVE